MDLLIISGWPHYHSSGGIAGLDPLTREIDYLAEVFGEVRHLAPLFEGPPPAHTSHYESGRVTLVPLKPSGGRGLLGKFDVLRHSLSYVRTIRDELAAVDMVHVRCPSNVSLEALLLLRVSRRRLPCWVKYGGNWCPSSPEPLSYRLQRTCLQTGWPNCVVTVNGIWPGQPKHVHSFLNPSFTAHEARQAFSATSHKHLALPVRLVYAGRLSPGKGAVRALQILAQLTRSGIDARLDFAGEGPSREILERLIGDLGLESKVGLPGWLTQSQLHSLYQQAHFVLLPSVSEGWPKVLSEAMAFGAVPMAGAVSCIPQVMAQTGAGVALPSFDTAAFADAITRFVREPAQWTAHHRNGYAAAHLFTYETHVDRVRQLLALDQTRTTLVPQQAAL